MQLDFYWKHNKNFDEGSNMTQMNYFLSELTQIKTSHKRLLSKESLQQSVTGV